MSKFRCFFRKKTYRFIFEEEDERKKEDYIWDTIENDQNVLEIGEDEELSHIGECSDAEYTCYHYFAFLTPILCHHLCHKNVG